MYTTGKFLAILFVVVIAINDVAGIGRNQKPGAREAKMNGAEASGRSDMFSNVIEAQVVAAEGRDDGDGSDVIFGVEKSGV
uniref:Putative secreted protein n=1 Tax=Ixodes ricinus TaxID=34613 RepID=A0A090X9E5_IXORI